MSSTTRGKGSTHETKKRRECELLPGDGHNGNVFISTPPGYEEDPLNLYHLWKPLTGMPSAGSCMAHCHERFPSTWRVWNGWIWKEYVELLKVTIDGHRILLGAHIDDFVIIACTNRQVFDAFCKHLLETFDGTYEGPHEHYHGCQIARDLVAGSTQLSQTHYAEEVLCTFGFWDNLPHVTQMKPNTRLSTDDCDPFPKPDFHKRFLGIVGSLGYLVTMTRPDLA